MPAMQRINATILLVDDDPNVPAALMRALRREPFHFLTATSGKEAIAILEAQPVDAIVADEQMPGMSGSEFLALARQRFPKSVRLILSGQASLDAAIRAINEGEVYRFLVKPVNPADLATTLRQAIEHKRLEEQSRRLLREFEKQQELIAQMRTDDSVIMRLDTDKLGAIVLNEEEERSSVADLLAEIEEAVQRR